jgi:hypothetical protein
VKRIAKIILGALAALGILLVIILVGINLYLQSGDVQQRIRAATEDALGMPVVVKRTLYFPWSGLTLSGLSLPDPTVSGANLVEAPTFSVQFQFWPLLARKLVISEVKLSSPRLVLRQTADKQWLIVPPPLPVPKVEKPNRPPPGKGRPGKPQPAYEVELKYVAVRDGTADIYDYRGACLGRITGLSIDATLTSRNRVEGHITIEDMEIAGLVRPNRLRADFVQDGELLSVTNLKCAIADGKVRAEFSILVPRKGNAAFQLKSEAEDVSLPTLLSDALLDSTGTTGRLRGTLELRGDPLDVATLVGGGGFALDAAQLQPFDFIQQIGRILAIEELQLLKLEEANLRYEIRDEKIWLTDARLRTENLLVTGQGPIKFNGKMNIDALFMVKDAFGERFGGLMSSQFIPSSVPGYRELPFKITGRTSRPESDLPEKLTGIRMNKLGNIGRMLQGFLAAPKPTPSPTPTSTAVQN